MNKYLSKKCCLQDWLLEGESNCTGGLGSLFKFRCRSCKKTGQFWSKPEKYFMDIADSSILGSMCEGFGYTNVYGQLACMGLEYISDKT